MNRSALPGSANFEDLYNRAPCGLLTYLISGTIVEINQTLLSWLNASREEMINKVFPDFLDRGGQLYYQLFVYPTLILQNEVKEINLQIRTSSVTFSCLFSASVTTHGAATIVHATIYKVADRKKYENELLKKKVVAEEENQQKAQALQDVAFYQSHLVRAPLANILGLVDLLEMDNSEEDNRNLISLLKESADQLDAVIRKIVNTTHS